MLRNAPIKLGPECMACHPPEFAHLYSLPCTRRHSHDVSEQVLKHLHSNLRICKALSCMVYNGHDVLEGVRTQPCHAMQDPSCCSRRGPPSARCRLASQFCTCCQTACTPSRPPSLAAGQALWAAPSLGSAQTPSCPAAAAKSASSARESAAIPRRCCLARLCAESNFLLSGQQSAFLSAQLFGCSILKQCSTASCRAAAAKLASSAHAPIPEPPCAVM